MTAGWIDPAVMQIYLYYIVGGNNPINPSNRVRLRISSISISGFFSLQNLGQT
jgi:hypothetical protein